MDKLRIVLADDHTVVRDGLRMVIDAQADMQVVGEAGTGRMAIQQSQMLQPDVVVMDVSMPDSSGMMATKYLRANHPNVKVLALSMHDEASYVRMLLEEGATGYVIKHSGTATLIAAIRMVAKGEVFVDPAVAGKIVADLLHGVTPVPPSLGTNLSDREISVLRLLAEGHSNREVADKLYLSTKTVETYKARAMTKLGLTTRTELVRYALHHGWLDKV